MVRCCAPTERHWIQQALTTSQAAQSLERRPNTKSHGLTAHWDYGVLEDRGGIVVAHEYHHMTRDHRLPSSHEATQINLSKLMKDCRWRYLGCGDDCGIFSVGRKRPPPCCSMLTREN